MDELVNIVVQRTGLSQEDARKAVQAVVDALKQRLPGPIASHLDAFLAGGVQAGVGALGQEAGELLKGKLGGMLGGMLGGDKT
jgi:uncharacterized protein (DUF2267 family)